MRGLGRRLWGALPLWARVLSLLVIPSLLGLMMWGGYTLYWGNVFPPKSPHYLYLPTGSTYQTVRARLLQSGLVADTASFHWVARQMGYPSRVKPGRYRLTRRMSNRALITMLRAGNQAPVPLRFESYRTPQELAEKLASQLEMPADSFLAALRHTTLLEELGVTQKTVIALFLPNTYEFYWTARPHEVLRRMHSAYQAFWTPLRRQQAEALNLTPLQVSTLASIVQAETYRTDERPRVAGVYLNRLRLDMLLQADPTVIYAVGDFTIRRVLNKHLETDSPYNTYKYAGLPPGPINNPTQVSIDAVLKPERHDYLYFAAKTDGSGYHWFSKTYREHVKRARDYQQQQNRSGR